MKKVISKNPLCSISTFQKCFADQHAIYQTDLKKFFERSNYFSPSRQFRKKAILAKILTLIKSSRPAKFISGVSVLVSVDVPNASFVFSFKRQKTLFFRSDRLVIHVEKRLVSRKQRPFYNLLICIPKSLECRFSELFIQLFPNIFNLFVDCWVCYWEEEQEISFNVFGKKRSQENPLRSIFVFQKLSCGPACKFSDPTNSFREK